MIIAVTNLKGGLLRTTTSMLLAESFRQLGYPVAVVDATLCNDCRTWAEELPEIPVHSVRLPAHMEMAPNQIAEFVDLVSSVHKNLGEGGVVVIDTNSHDQRIIELVNQVASHVLVPANDAPASTEPTLATIAAATAPLTVFSSALESSLPHEVIDAVKNAGGHVASSTISYAWDEKFDPRVVMPEYINLARELAAA